MAATTETQPEAASTTDVSLVQFLAQDPRLQTMFLQFPGLRAKLRHIFDTTTIDDQDGSRPTINGRGQGYQGSPQKRMARSLRILGAQLDSETAESSGLKAFAQLVAELAQNQQEPGLDTPNPETQREVFFP